MRDMTKNKTTYFDWLAASHSRNGGQKYANAYTIYALYFSSSSSSSYLVLILFSPVLGVSQAGRPQAYVVWFAMEKRCLSCAMM